MDRTLRARHTLDAPFSPLERWTLLRLSWWSLWVAYALSWLPVLHALR